MSDAAFRRSPRGTVFVLVLGTIALFAVSTGGGCLKSPDGGEIESWSGADRTSDAGSREEQSTEGGSASGGSGLFDVGAGGGRGSGGGASLDAGFRNGSDAEEPSSGTGGGSDAESEKRGSDGGSAVDPGDCVGDTCPAPCPDVGVQRDADVSSDVSVRDAGSADVETDVDDVDVRCR